MQPSSTVSGGDTTTTTIAATSATNTNTTSWAQSLMTSIRDFFTQEPASEPESDALAGWVGMRKGRGRCRSVGEVH
ncbi:hypothetical protein N7509_005731 [Penicillium cosmopolitanum]|uniref:Uncharacterized protein n=1 Tax=Penicillium cosmopolitanum TaxID=1131564 RepID=A0A9W9W333_9EURO|nr:uncharacterized protein N7509_005731 [Penicillium cosmopolitanum]KAJ5397618.1 hypothetical protein N7509_005731 [Penicillium cosmopolitanum]